MVQSSARAPARPAASERRAQRSRCRRRGSRSRAGRRRWRESAATGPCPTAAGATTGRAAACRVGSPLRSAWPCVGALPGAHPGERSGAGSEQTPGRPVVGTPSRRYPKPGRASCPPSPSQSRCPAEARPQRRNSSRERGGAAGPSAQWGEGGPPRCGERRRSPPGPAGCRPPARRSGRAAGGRLSGRAPGCQAPCPPRGDPERLPAWAAGRRAPHALVLQGAIILPGEMRKMRTRE